MSSVPENTHPVTTETTTAQHLWETAVCLASIKARAALPHSNGRVDKAMALVLGGAVELLDDHSARVTSQRDGETRYFVVNGACTCPDYERAPVNQCKHRIARGLMIRALQIAKDLGQASTALTPVSSTDLTLGPDDLVSTPGVAPQVPPQFLVEIQGRTFVTFHGLLAMAHQVGLLSLSARFISVTAELALAEATAMFHDGRTFTEAADSTPQNVNSRIAPHFARMALTRAKARCLRDALNIAAVCAEELA